ncbi:cyclase family protein [Thalassobaculum sp.]|uniref:cyclase family protein n=1 Tax=Thalassobaculum sp. TaxID=2022740 RepID=UPI003B5C0DAE
MRRSKFEAGDGTDPISPSRRDFMKTAAIGAAAGSAAFVGSGGSDQLAQAQTSSTEPWWPSRWGADDQAGASNWMTPEKTLQAASQIKEGKVYKIGRMYEAGMPMFGARVFSVRIPGAPTGGPYGQNNLIYNDEFLATEIGQVGTQFDGLGHIGVVAGDAANKADQKYYNGFDGSIVSGAYGLGKLGVEHVKPFFTPAHLIDVHGSLGEMKDAGYEITLADVQGALSKQGMSEGDIRSGDAVFFNTGWGSLWMKNNDRFNSGCPGIGMEVARWLIEKEISITGADTWPTEVVPNPDPNLAFPVHAELITKNGIFNHENLFFDELIADGKYRFVYVFAPMPIKGATGSAGSPIAIT